MGAVSFDLMATGYSADEVFRDLVALDAHNKAFEGRDSGISMCSLNRCTLRFDKWHKSNQDKAAKHVKACHYGQKLAADYVDLGVNNPRP